MSDIVKKPVGGAYGVFQNERREELKKQAEAAGDTGFGAVAKLASAAWKVMGDAEKAPYEKKYQAAKDRFAAFKGSDAYVAPEKKLKKGKFAKLSKDKDAPKKPVGGAYGVFTSEKRETFKKQAEAAGDKSFGGGAKLASAAWKALSEEEQQTYEQKYKAAAAKYKIAMAEYGASQPADTLEQETPKKQKATKDKDAPKKPVGGAYGVFTSEKRETFKKQAEATGDKSFGGGAKLASAAWKALSDEERQIYEEKYMATAAEYKTAIAEYNASKPAGIPEQVTPTKQKAATAEKASPKKRAASGAPKAAAAPKLKAAKVDPAACSAALDAAVLKEAEGLGYKARLENLANREAIIDGKFDAAKLLGALKEAGGLVNKAKAALCGA